MTLLSEIRTGRYAELALVAATVVGLAASTVHWSGLVLGGVLVGVLATSVRRAVVSGLTFGGLSIALQTALVWRSGGLDAYFEMGIILVLSVAIGFALPMLGAVGARAVTPDG
ncbi:hypothetical protein ACFQJC_10195 [Haloferax namakaokahaiae]|uniref:Uncharacterized protein n=1 Tax=Haloferax namakaokahaiae TaxID=1748331 RepID=A0ABD5ZG72_9EURY